MPAPGPAAWPAGNTRTGRRTAARTAPAPARPRRPSTGCAGPRPGRGLPGRRSARRPGRPAPIDRVVRLVAAQDRLEAAVPAVVAEVAPAHVERGRVGGDWGGVDEHELGLWVQVPADQPGARGPVDAHPRAGRPPHGRSSSSSPAAKI